MLNNAVFFAKPRDFLDILVDHAVNLFSRVIKASGSTLSMDSEIPLKTRMGNSHLEQRSQRLSLLLSEIWSQRSVSRSDLQRATGLSLPTVTRLVQDLKAVEAITETDKSESSGGRRPSVIRANPEAGVVIGLDLSGIELRGAILDAANHCLKVTKQAFRGMQAPMFQEQVLQLCRELISDPLIGERRVLGIGVSVPGTVDAERGIIRDAVNIHVQNYPIRDILKDTFELPVFIEHDTLAAAIAEKHYGVGRGCGDLMYIVVSTGIGACWIANHTAYRGATGQAGELGHVVVERNGQVCVCGKHGCLEAVAAVPAMLSSAQNVLLRQKRSPADTLSLTALIRASEQGDRLAQAIIDRAADYLAMAISAMVSIVDIRLLIIGGEVVQMGERYFLPLRHSFQEYRPGGDEVKIVPAALGENASLQGVSMIVLQNVLAR